MTPRALVVDDDTSMVKTLTDVLTLHGWSVATALSGEDGVEAVIHQAFDVVLMDVKMGGMDGVSAFKEMKATRPNIRVVLMTAYAAQDLLAEAEREGVMRILPKPVNVGALLSLIASQVGRKQSVLIVDHDSAFIRTLSGALALHGIETATASNLRRATQLILERHPAAVLLHMHLDSASAREAAGAVHRVSPDTALILYSGMPGAADEVEQVIPDDWIHAYLQKPFAVAHLTRMLDGIAREG